MLSVTIMARLNGVQDNEAGLYVGLVYRFIRRAYGRVMQSARIAALNPRLLRAVAAMERGQQALRSIDPSLVALAEIKVATLIGCPF